MTRIDEVFDSEGNVISSIEVPYTERELANHLAAYRDKRLYEGVTVGGVTVGTDDLTQQRLIGARISAVEDSEYTVKWKTPNGFATLTANQIIEIADAVRDHVQKCFDAEEAISGQSFDSIADLEAAFDAEMSS